MMQVATGEIVPLTEDQKQAIRDCRFSTTNVPRDHAWIIYEDEKITMRLAGVVKRSESYTRDRVTNTKEHEALIGHPEAIEIILQEMSKRAAK